MNTMKHKVGDKVRITRDIYGHDFEIGSIQTIKEVSDNDYMVLRPSGCSRHFTDKECVLYAEPTSTESQCQMIRKHLESHFTLTNLEALEMFGCWRLGARINDLRKLGMKIKTEMITLPNKKRVAKYSLI